MSYTPQPILNTIPADDTDSSGVATRLLPQRVDRIGFTKSISNGIDPDWGTIVGSISTGMDVDQIGGNLVVTSGTTARSETIIRSTKSWEGGIRLRARVTLSQRIVDNNFFVELVDVIGDSLSITAMSATTTHNATWTRVTTTATITMPGHGLIVGTAFDVTISSETLAITTGAKAVLAVTNNNTFTLTCLDAGATSGTLTYTTSLGITVTIPANPFTSENIGQSMYMGAINLVGGSSPVINPQRIPIADISGTSVTFVSQGQSGTLGTGTCSLFGWNYYQLQYQGTTATAVNFDTQRNGWANGFTTASVNTTANPGHLIILTGNDLAFTLTDQLIASTGTIQQTIRGTRAENIPDDVSLRLQIRILNGITAPVSNTTLTIGLISMSNFAAQDVSIQDIRPTGLVPIPTEILRGLITTVTTLSTLTTLANGQTAHSSASTGSPLRIGGRVLPVTPDLTLAAGDASDIGVTTQQQIATKDFADAALDYGFGGSITNSTTAIVFKNAAGASIRNMVTALNLQSDTLGAATEVVILDGALTSTSVASNVITVAAHDYKIGDQVVFSSIGSFTGIVVGTPYWVLTVPSTTTYTLSATPNGSTLTVGGTGSPVSNRVLYRTKLQTTASTINAILPSPLRGRPNATLSIQTVTASVTGTVYYNIQGYIGF